MIISMKKEARAMEKVILVNIPELFTCEKTGLEFGLAQAAGLLGNLVARKS
jgi:hypothetical protein